MLMLTQFRSYNYNLMENYYRVTFKAQLLQFTLAFKAECTVDLFWKKGEKIAQSKQVPFANMIGKFNQELSINCNMVFDVQNKVFLQKITKFQIILYTEKGNKKVGEIHFNVATYLNQRLKTPKEYELPLEKCPDKNARLTFKLTASVDEKISKDAISHSSDHTVNVQNLVDNGKAKLQSNIFAPSNPSQVSVKEVPSPKKENKGQRKFTTATSIEVQPTRQDADTNSTEKNKDLQSQNKKMRQKLKARQKFLRENEQLKKKIKNEQYDTVKEIKQKIENSRKQVQKLQSTIKKQILLEKEVKAIEDEIFKCKYQIMNAFNYANQKGGGKLMFEMQEACGLKEV